MEKIVKDLYRLYDKLCSMQNFTLQTPAAKKFYDELIGLLSTPMTDAEVSSLVEQIPFRKDFIIRHNNLRLMSEIEAAKGYLDGRYLSLFDGSWFGRLSPSILRDQVEHWKQLGFDFSQRDKKLAMVGGGALPQSQIYFANYTGVPVTCIDRDDEVVSLLRQVLKKKGHDDLPVIRSEGDQVDYSEFDLVVVAATVENKANILKQIRETSDSWVCVRNPFLLYQLVREPLIQEDIDELGFHVIGSYHQGSNISIVLQPIY